MHTHDSLDGASRRALTPPGRLVSVHVTLHNVLLFKADGRQTASSRIAGSVCVMQIAETGLMRECTRCACNELLTCIGKVQTGIQNCDNENLNPA